MSIEIRQVGSGKSAESILRETFGKVAIGEIEHFLPGKIVHTCAIPNLYTWKPVHSPLVSQVREFLGAPLKWEVGTIQGLGLTREESIKDMFQKTVWKAMRQDLCMLERQKTQGLHPVKIGGIYRSVHLGDKDHDHKDPRLANFISVDYHPLYGFIKGSLNKRHSHLWIG